MADDPKPSNSSTASMLLKSKTFIIITLLTGLQTLYESGRGLYLILSTEEHLSSTARLFGILGTSVPFMLSTIAFIFMIKGVSREFSVPIGPSGRVFDFIMPPEDAEYRALAMEIAFENWRSRYSLPVT